MYVVSYITIYDERNWHVLFHLRSLADTGVLRQCT